MSPASNERFHSRQRSPAAQSASPTTSQAPTMSPVDQRRAPRTTNAAEAAVFENTSCVRSPTRTARSRLITAPTMIDVSTMVVVTAVS